MIDAHEARRLLDYETETGVLRWRVRMGPRAMPGSVAGSVNGEGYRIVGISKRYYAAHRLAWLIHHGRWPADQIDHINKARTDNRLCNLREATNAENCRYRNAA